MISSEALTDSMQEAFSKVRSCDERVVAAKAELTEAERELRLLMELAQMRGVDVPAGLRMPKRLDVGGNGDEPSRRNSSDKQNLLNAVVGILAEQGKPMQIRDLMAAVQKREVRIPGRGQQANLIAHISRDPRISRPSRGFYALKEWGGEEAKSVPRRRKRSRTRRKGTAK